MEPRAPPRSALTVKVGLWVPRWRAAALGEKRKSESAIVSLSPVRVYTSQDWPGGTSWTARPESAGANERYASSSARTSAAQRVLKPSRYRGDEYQTVSAGSRAVRSGGTRTRVGD